ncbi:Fe-S biogenesis protein NfuA [Acinetobacter guillouiae]|jgi:Fe/S biogenesis protein NfuA|uniref:Fe/S biogenesis protein NfuA n=2 Tax=Acinetobacter guillouiae TaxID=106649 RepID=N8WYV8_ACIGI|nr:MULTISPECIES: Fe-S biogenesis protein NfuA [Acinetobacter]ENV17171.1 Fe/S biogenesis protein nfuA [Acinetobacter guillouiae NIPH 991]KEC83484.1 amino acid ABC transporter substrate-binding protein [Acinetobacter sp. ETR1]KQW98069.1 Fe/S biogenesis protein NfuA [Acinetobacter sp. Root1280]MBP2544361.1 Fe/S biogenesis protein NfuA [Acinetobacter guillouiae]MCF0263247.1 Fe-S biogenesis protein NfuA [Acinetobacter guillouiae]
MSTENTNTAVAEEIPNLLITPNAQEYLKDLLEKQNTPGIGVRVFVENPGTPRAECCMAYSAPDEIAPTDYKQDYPDFPAFIDTPSIPYLKDAVIDYNKDRFGGQLTFRAPNSKVPRVGPDASMEERITYILQAEINPGLAGHGGNCALVEVVEDEEHGLTAVLKFGGGCQGCSAIDVTLKQGVETTLKEHIPELGRVVDQTDHSQAEGAYFK